MGGRRIVTFSQSGARSISILSDQARVVCVDGNLAPRERFVSDSNELLPGGNARPLGGGPMRADVPPDVEPMTLTLLGRFFGVPLLIIGVVVAGAVVVVLLFGGPALPQKRTVESLIQSLESNSGDRSAGLLLPREKELWQTALELSERLPQQNGGTDRRRDRHRRRQACRDHRCRFGGGGQGRQTSRPRRRAARVSPPTTNGVRVASCWLERNETRPSASLWRSFAPDRRRWPSSPCRSWPTWREFPAPGKAWLRS